MEKVNKMISVQETKAKKKNKGFSLVELIIVIAIMAILVGVVGTQVVPYLEKSREAKDKQVVSAICTAAVTAFAENADLITSDATYTYTSASDATVDSGSKINSSLKELLGVAASGELFDYLSGGTGDTAAKLESKKGKTAKGIEIKYTVATGAISVQLKNGTANVLDPVTSK